MEPSERPQAKMSPFGWNLQQCMELSQLLLLFLFFFVVAHRKKNEIN